MLKRILTFRFVKRSVSWVYNNIKEIIHHLGQEICDVLIWNTKVRVCVNLYEPKSEIFINKEVISEKLKAILSSVGVELVLRG